MNKKAFIAGQTLILSFYALSYGCRTPLDSLVPQFIDVQFNPYCHIKSFEVEPDEGNKNFPQSQHHASYTTISGTATTATLPAEQLKKT